MATVATDTPPWRGIWPLPLTGTLNVRAGFVQYQRYRAAPVAAKFVLEHERVHVTATEVAVCGISFPFVADLTPGGVVASVALEAKDRQLEATVRCLSEESALVTGTFDLRGELHTEGRRDELIDHLAGTLEVRIHEGEIRKLALLGNILALKNVTRLFSRGVPNIGNAGFHYREITATGSFGGGKFTLEQGALDSDAMGLVANGTVGLRDERADLTVLVAPFGSLDRLVRRLPLLGYVIGGALTSIPVGVSGSLRNPLVLPLGPEAVTSQLVGIFERTLKLPGKLLPSAKGGSKPATSGK